MNKTTAISTQRKGFSLEPLSKFTTPQLLKGGLYLTWGASLLVLITTISGVQGQRHAIKTVGKDSAPSILNAQRVKDSLADMDANVANELLVKPGQNQEAVKGYEYRRERLTNFLVDVAENITYGDAEKIPIQTITYRIGDYIQKAQRARDFNERGDRNGVVVAYREAAEIMDKTLLPAADALARTNLAQLERTYAAERFAAGRSLFFIVISGLLLIAVLVSIQLFLYYRMRRILNPMLLAATAIALIFTGYTTQILLAASNHLKVAKEDAFMSLYDLRQGRSLAYSANADESRYLLDSSRAATHEQAFFEKVTKIAKTSNNQTFETVAATAAAGQKVWGFTGFLANELNNITFEGEREAAVKTVKTFGTYLALDKQIRQLEQSGKHAEAIALCIGYNPGQSNWAFEQFKQANDEVININQKEFDQAIEQAFKDVEGFEIKTSVATVAIALLTLVGLLPRLKEYS